MPPTAPSSESRPKAAEASPAQPACDQCRIRKIRCNRQLPECSNCSKAGVSCDFSDRGKRVNHTKQLVDDFSCLSARLDSIDESIARMSQHISVGSPVSASNSFGAADLEDLELFRANLSTDLDVREELDRQNTESFGGLQHVVDERGGERLHGFTASIALFDTTKKLLERLLEHQDEDAVSGVGSRRSSISTIKEDSQRATILTNLFQQNPSVRMELLQSYEVYPFTAPWREADISGDGKPIASPPRSLLDASIDTFIGEINAATPVFEESRLRQAIDEHYSGTADETGEEARSLCFNNIILLTLTLKSKLARRMNTHVGGLDEDLLSSFLKNARRALSNLSRFFSPRLINLQALVTLTMVAREYFEGQIFERISQMTCHVARFMGLQQWNRIRSDQPAMDTERINLFWTLFVNDKQRAFLTGQPCDFYLFDSDLRLQKPVTESSFHHFHLAHVHLMSLWEEVYLSLYSLRAARKGVQHRQEQCIKMHALFRNWSIQYKDLLNKPGPDDTPLTINLRLELKYCFNIGQILVHRCHSQESSRQQVLTSARAALAIIRDVSQTDFSLGGTFLLCRLLRRYPALAFHELQYHFLRTLDPSALDPHLLVGMRDALTPLRHAGFQRAYYTRLHLGVEWSLALTTKLRHAVLQLPPSLTASAASSRPTSGPSTPKSKPASTATTNGTTTPARKRSANSSRATSSSRVSEQRPSVNTNVGPRHKRKSTSRTVTAGNSPINSSPAQLASPNSAMEDVQHWYPYPASGPPSLSAGLQSLNHPPLPRQTPSQRPSVRESAAPAMNSNGQAPYHHNPPLFSEPTSLPALSHSPPEPTPSSSMRAEAGTMMMANGSRGGRGTVTSEAFGSATLVECTAGQDAGAIWADLCGDLGTDATKGSSGANGNGMPKGIGSGSGEQGDRSGSGSGAGNGPGELAALDMELLDGFVPYANGWGGQDPWDTAVGAGSGGDEMILDPTVMAMS